MQVILEIMAKAALFLVFLSYVCFVFRPDSLGECLGLTGSC
jgi:cbb3-type cytochrome oxidase subunit 3